MSTMPVEFSPSRKSRILVVDDDASIRNVCSALLACSGYGGRYCRGWFQRAVEHQVLPCLIFSSPISTCRTCPVFELLSVVRRRFPQIVVVSR